MLFQILEMLRIVPIPCDTLASLPFHSESKGIPPPLFLHVRAHSKSNFLLICIHDV